MLDKVKTALRISTTAFDDEINDLIAAALADLGIAGIVNTDITDPLIIRAVIVYCKANFGQTEDGWYDRLMKSYDQQKGQLQMATGYTDWGDNNE